MTADLGPAATPRIPTTEDRMSRPDHIPAPRATGCGHTVDQHHHLAGLEADTRSQDQAVRELTAERDGAREDRDRYARTAANLLHQRNEAASQLELTIADLADVRQQLGRAQELLANLRHLDEQRDRAWAAYDTVSEPEPSLGSPAPHAQDEPASWHVTRGTGPSDLEDDCPCPKEPCGSVDTRRTDPACEQHPAGRARTMRQMHRADQCPAERAEG